MDVQLIVLVNAGSASASEIFSGIMQDLDRGVIVGTKTFGKGLARRMSIRLVRSRSTRRTKTAACRWSASMGGGGRSAWANRRTSCWESICTATFQGLWPPCSRGARWPVVATWGGQVYQRGAAFDSWCRIRYRTRVDCRGPSRFDHLRKKSKKTQMQEGK